MSRRIQQFTYRDMHKLLIANGYYVDRYSGSHCIYTNGENTIAIPAGKKQLNMMLVRGIIKRNNITERRCSYGS